MTPQSNRARGGLRVFALALAALLAGLARVGAEVPPGTLKANDLLLNRSGTHTVGLYDGAAGAGQRLAPLGDLPLRFEANHGQADPRVKFVSRGPGYAMLLTDTGAVFSLTRRENERNPDGAAATPTLRDRKAASARRSVLRVELVGANPQPRIRGVEQQPGRAHYLIGNDPQRWRQEVPSFARVNYAGVYPGVDMVYYGNDQELEYDFVVAPGADPGRIAVRFTGATGARIDARGDLVLALPGGEVVQKAPVIYQTAGGKRRAVPGGYRLRTRKVAGRPVTEARFRVGRYDRTRPLVIDPVVSYSTYFGGGHYDYCYGMAVDASGNIYVTGLTESFNLPPVNAGMGDPDPVLDAPSGSPIDSAWDAFVTKISADGSTVLYSTYLGGGFSRVGYATWGSAWADSEDFANAIAVDGARCAYVTGRTHSPNFPVTANAFQPAFAGRHNEFDPHKGGDAFVAKLSAAGNALVYSTYLGGSRGEEGYDIAVDGAGNACVTGYTTSLDYPTANAAQPAWAGGSSLYQRDVFVTKLNATGTGLVFSTYLGGSEDDKGNVITLDSSGAVYVAGNTGSANFPVLNAFQGAYAGPGSVHGDGGDAFVAKYDAAGTRVYATFLGGSSHEGCHDVAVDATGCAYVVGVTPSDDFPLRNPLQPTSEPGDDAFVTKLDPTGGSLVYSTYLGGTAFDGAYAVAVDSTGRAWIAGNTTSSDFPLANALRPKPFTEIQMLPRWDPEIGDYIRDPEFGDLIYFPTPVTILDTFVAQITPAGDTLEFSTYAWSGGYVAEIGLHTESTGGGSPVHAYVAGGTDRADRPTVNALQPGFAGWYDTFIIKLSPTAATPTGTQVEVPLSNEVSLDFGTVTGSGETTITVHDVGTSTSPVLPANFEVSSETSGEFPTFFDIHTTAIFIGNATVCVRYNPDNFPWHPVTNPSGAKPSLLHFENGVWVDITTSIHTVNHEVCGTTSSFSPFLVARTLPVRAAQVDIRPGSYPNTINLGSNGVVSVAILSAPDFDARSVDPATVMLASAPVKLNGKGTSLSEVRDVNGDGLPDLVVQVQTSSVQLTDTEREAQVDAKLRDRSAGVRGRDTVRVVP